jgi:hypothetical protein
VQTIRRSLDPSFGMSFSDGRILQDRSARTDRTQGILFALGEVAKELAAVGLEPFALVWNAFDEPKMLADVTVVERQLRAAELGKVLEGSAISTAWTKLPFDIRSACPAATRVGALRGGRGTSKAEVRLRLVANPAR